MQAAPWSAGKRPPASCCGCACDAGLLALARSQNGQLAYSSAGVGSPHHLAMALLTSMGGVEIIHAPFRGTALPMIRDGWVRPIAAAGARR